MNFIDFIKSKRNKLSPSKTGIALGAAVITLVLSLSVFPKGYSQQDKTEYTKEETAPTAEKIQGKNTNAVEMYQLTQYKKSPINEYDMSRVSESKTKKESTENDENNFTVEFPDSGESYRDDKPSPLYLSATRSISDEYYTVFDENTGKNVTLNGHDLICQIVNNEVGDSWGEEAIKAQALAAYSYMRYGDANGYIRQVGLKADYSSFLESVVSSVEGQAVFYNGSIINGVYSASTAGYSTASVKVWGGNMGYLQAVKSSYDSKDPHWQDKKEFSRENMKKTLEKALNIRLSDNPKNWFDVQSCYSVRYIDKISIDGQKIISGVKLCNILDVLSNAMDISFSNDTFTVATYGWGHGVGLSQWGAKLYAQNGWTYDQILRHYYVDTTVELSCVNEKAVERGKMSAEELEKEAENATVEKPEKAVETDAEAKDEDTKKISKDEKIPEDDDNTDNDENDENDENDKEDKSENETVDSGEEETTSSQQSEQNEISNSDTANSSQQENTESQQQADTNDSTETESDNVNTQNDSSSEQTDNIN